MVYKKYIKKNGKLYGPYYYKSKRVDGKVISEYHGSERENLTKEKKKFDSSNLKKSAAFLFILLFLAVGVYFLIEINEGSAPLAGFSVLNLNADYKEGENLDGSLSLVLNEGELLPASSQVVFESENQSYNYSLQELVLDEKVVGNFYLAGSNISGEGIGYGIEGKKTIYPGLSFVLLVSERISENETSEEEIKANVSKEKEFIYNLEENETAEIRDLSVKNEEGEKMPDELLSLQIKNNTAIVSTNYSQTELGFGEEYRGEAAKELLVDLSKLNLSLESPNLTVRVKYSNNNLIDLSLQLKEEIVEEETNELENISSSENLTTNETENASVEIIDEFINETFGAKVDSFYVLTEEDKSLLRNTFPNESVEITQSVMKNSRIFVKYELGSHWFEATYSSNSSDENIRNEMEIDKIRWLKDIVNKIRNEEDSEVEVSEFLGEQSF